MTPRGNTPASPQARRRAARAWARRGAVTLAIAAAVALLAFALRPTPLSVELGQVTRGPMTVTVDEDGRTRVRDRYVVAAPLTGVLARAHLRPGDRIETGTIVARIWPPTSPLLDDRSRAEAEGRREAAADALRRARAEIARAKVGLEQAERDAAQLRQLASSGAIPRDQSERADELLRLRREEVTAADFAARTAGHEVEVAAAALKATTSRSSKPGEQMTLTSPIAGAVLKVMQESEGLVPAGTALLELGDPSALEAVVDLLTTDAVRVRPGAPATLERWGGEGALRAHVRRVEPAAFTRVSALGVEEQRVNVILDIDDAPERRAALGDGFRVEARIELWSTPSAVIAPTSALFRRGEQWAVFVLEGGKARLKSVTLGQRNDAQAEIRAGLAEGEQVVVHPSDRVVDGAKIVGR